MTTLSQKTEALAARLARVQGISVDEAVRRALEPRAPPTSAATGARRRQTVEQMLAVGAEIAAMPLLDRRSPNEILDDLDAS